MSRWCVSGKVVARSEESPRRLGQLDLSDNGFNGLKRACSSGPKRIRGCADRMQDDGGLCFDRAAPPLYDCLGALGGDLYLSGQD